jgi:hypothetical protein
MGWDISILNKLEEETVVSDELTAIVFNCNYDFYGRLELSDIK